MKTFPALSRAAAYLIVLAAWAAIYLPGLGSMEIKGEEVRRIMPGVNMLATGNWIVPEFNGEPYLRKPPLVNWAIAGSIKLFGVRNEWTARLPSAVAMLAMDLVMVWSCGPWLGTNAALAAALMALTSAGMVDKGRLAEIEAIYIALFGMAFSCWIGWTAMGKSRWLTWTATGALLGLGLLAKGPATVGYFYAIVGLIAVEGWRVSRKPESQRAADTGLVSWAHLWGIALMLAMIACWWIPYSHDPATHGAGGVMARQLEQRLGEGNKGTIFINFLRSYVNFLPWGLGLPLFWNRRTLDMLAARDRQLVVGARWPIVLCAFGLMLVPGMLPRYTLPLIIPYALLLAVLLKARMAEGVARWPLAAAGVAGAGMMVFGFGFGARVARHGPARDFAAQINSRMPAGSTIYIFDPSVQPEIFYINGKLVFTGSVKELPNDVPWLLAPESAMKLLRARYEKCTVLAETKEESGRKFDLVELHGARLGRLNLKR